MKCKNCKHSIHIDTNFCDECGAKVVQERITFRSLRKDIMARFFGWDNKLFFTTKMLFTRPHVIIQEYLGGVRKKYMNPFSYFGIVVAISFLVFSQFEKQFTQLNDLSIFDATQIDTLEVANTLVKENEATSTTEIYVDSTGQTTKSNNPFSDPAEKGKMMKFMLKYFNIIQFINLPFYALLSFLVYRKKHNYGEHLVINAFIQGAITIFAFVLFFIGFFTSFKFGLVQFLFIFGYYVIVMKLLHDHGWKKTMLMVLKFVGVLGLFFICSMILGVIIVLILKFMGLIG